MNKASILLVDDEANIRYALSTCLKAEGYEVYCCATSSEALLALEEHNVDLAILDVRIGGESGIELFKKIGRTYDTPTVFISGNATLAEAAKSIQDGAFDFLEKPFSNEKLLVTVKNGIETRQLKEKLRRFEEEASREILGEHPKVVELVENIKKISKTDSTVLISGESGTGKELIAKAIHNCSARAKHAFIKVNCSAIPENLVESALFGHVKGAFTGANSNKKGYFELAHGGTLFLDEIGDTPLSTQASLLRALESSEIQKVGAEKIETMDVRLIAASHKDLKAEVKQGRFREDLLYRISVLPIYSPPLRERGDDIVLLAEHILKEVCKKNNFPEKFFDKECFAILNRYSWPGNIRELRNTIERMAILGGRELKPHDIPPELTLVRDDATHSTALSLKDYRELAEREYILRCLKETQGNITQCAKMLQLDRAHLYKKMAQYEIQRESSFC